MRIKKHTAGKRIVGYVMWLSANDTYNWAHRDGAAWPCSTVDGRALCVECDLNGLCDISRSDEIDGHELDAIVSDYLPADCHHLWPLWK